MELDEFEPFEGGSVPVSRYMAEAVYTVASHMPLCAAARCLVESSVGALVVTEGDVPVAVISERDIARAVAKGDDLSSTDVLQRASRPLLWCSADATVSEVAREMMEHFVRHVLVEDEGRLVGIVSARDLLGAYLRAARTADQ